MSSPRLALAANRSIGVYAASLLREHNWPPVCLLLAESPADNSAEEIRKIFPEAPLLIGEEFRKENRVAFLGELKLDLILCVHFP